MRIIKLFNDIDIHHDTGVYMVRLKKDGIMYEIIVDDYIPLQPKGNPSFVQPLRN